MVGKVNWDYGLWSGGGMSTVVMDARVLWRAAFFSGINLVAELDHGVRVHAWAQGLRWRACELATDS